MIFNTNGCVCCFPIFFICYDCVLLLLLFSFSVEPNVQPIFQLMKCWISPHAYTFNCFRIGVRVRMCVCVCDMPDCMKFYFYCLFIFIVSCVCFSTIWWNKLKEQPEKLETLSKCLRENWMKALWNWISRIKFSVDSIFFICSLK